MADDLLDRILRITGIWEKAWPTTLDASLWRLDDCGALMYRFDYGSRSSEYGWEIDHEIPLAFGGATSSANERPLFWRNNVARNDPLPVHWSLDWKTMRNVSSPLSVLLNYGQSRF